MQPIALSFCESRGVARTNYIAEQGIPLPGITREEAANLAVFDEAGVRVPANVQIEATDHEDRVKWVLVSLPVSAREGEEKRFTLKDAGDFSPAGGSLQVSIGSEIFKVIKTPFFTLELTNPGDIRLSTGHGTVLEGAVGFDIRSDARSSVGNQRPVEYEARGFDILERTDKRVKVILRGRYRAWAPKNFVFDPVQRYDADLEMTIHADSPAIRLQWRITDHMKFNCSYMWLDRYVLTLPLAGGSLVAEGELADSAGAQSAPGRVEAQSAPSPPAGRERVGVRGDDEETFSRWVACQTPGGKFALTFPFHDWLGAGAGIEVKDGRVGHGGINPPPDGGFGGKVPDIHRKFYYGMSRTFEASLLVNPTEDDILSELNHLPLIVPPKHYSDCGELPENGSEITFGPWRDAVDRAAAHLLDTQWKGTLWFGEWWRETDVDHDLGVEETNSGNSALGPLYHFYRTGDWRFWESAKMSYLYTWDLQFCKREDGWGPYMHTRRFLLDHQEWFHPRYQRVGGMIRCSHFFGDPVAREKVMWYLRFWGEHYVAEDGAPMAPHGDTKAGPPTADQLSKCTESAMSNFADSLMFAYTETRDPWFLEKARLIGDWVVRGAEADMDDFCGNSNSTRYILRGLLQLCKVTGDQRYIDTFCKIAEWTVNSQTFEFGTHYVAFHFYYACQAYKWCGRREILDGILNLAQWVLSKESPDAPGTYPFPQRNQYPATRWICIYDNKAIVSYLPVLASTLAEAGIAPE